MSDTRFRDLKIEIFLKALMNCPIKYTFLLNYEILFSTLEDLKKHMLYIYFKNSISLTASTTAFLAHMAFPGVFSQTLFIVQIQILQRFSHQAWLNNCASFSTKLRCRSRAPTTRNSWHVPWHGKVLLLFSCNPNFQSDQLFATS